MVGERLKERFDREPVWRKATDVVQEPGHNIRSRVNNTFSGRIPEFRYRNIGGGLTTGTVAAVVATVLEDTVGLPFGGSADVVSAEPVDKGMRYVIDVNAPLESMAKVRAFIDAGTGFTSLVTDQLDVQDTEIIKTRTLRDTYRVTLEIEN